MVESYICYGLQPKMVSSVALPKFSRDGPLELSNVHRGGPAPGGSASANELHLRRRMASHGVVDGSNFASKGFLQFHNTAGGRAMSFESSLETVGKPVSSLRRVQGRNKLENDREDAVSSAQEEKGKEKSVDKKQGLVENIEVELGRQFGGALWFSVLLLCLAFFGGVYVFLIVNYADFSDIPILRGPQR